MNNISFETSYLFATPSFLSGMAQVLDMGGTMVEYNTQKTGIEADRIALLNDWMAVGNDLRTVMKQYEQQR